MTCAGVETNEPIAFNLKIEHLDVNPPHIDVNLPASSIGPFGKKDFCLF